MIKSGNQIPDPDDDRYTRITLRIPKNLHARLQNSSDLTSKSMNADIIARLEESFKGATSGFTQENIDRLSAQMQALLDKLPDQK